jgi:hypothetical protein
VSAESFLYDAVELDDVSVGRDEDVFEVTCRSHDGDGKIDTEPVHDLALEHDLRVRNTIADFDTGEVRLELIPAGGEADA